MILLIVIYYYSVVCEQTSKAYRISFRHKTTATPMIHEDKVYELNYNRTTDMMKETMRKSFENEHLRELVTYDAVTKDRLRIT